MAVAGFGASDLHHRGEGEYAIPFVARKQTEDGGSPPLLHRGIAARNFERRFQLADHVLVERRGPRERFAACRSRCAKLPEAMKPRTVPITTKSDKPKVIDSKAAA